MFDKVAAACQGLTLEKEAVLEQMITSVRGQVYPDDINSLWRATRCSPSTRSYSLQSLDESEKALQGVAVFSEILDDVRKRHVRTNLMRYKTMK